ncbi:MAG: SIS domain-containing protein [Pseudomonadales bacterium]|nr:SIS domain-containing protein [Pseudomonadales bacterium]
MTELLERTAWWFDVVSESLQQTFLAAGSAIALGAECLVDALVHDRKILLCGNGGSAANAQAFVSLMLNRYQRERPALPALLLTPDLATFSAIVGEYSFADVFARSVRAFGKPGDVLLCLSATGQASNVLQAIEAAHDRKMPVLAITGYDGGDVIRMLHEGDVSVLAPLHQHALVHAAHLTILHCLAHLIDEQLFGVDDA